VAYTISEPCIGLKDKSCIEECPVDCIYEGDPMLYIQLTSAWTAAPASRSARRGDLFRG
jgi:NAD-dependent dihydropyrimidine dehydrogenase PreA subunit